MSKWKFVAETQAESKQLLWRWELIDDAGHMLLQSCRAFRTPNDCVNDAKRLGYRDRIALPLVDPEHA